MPILWVLVAASACWITLVLLAPLMPASIVSAIAYVAGAVVCHQRPDRSFHLAGAQLPVCARCTGLYAGAFLGALAWGLARARVAWRRSHLRGPLALAAAPTAITVATGSLGWWDAGNTTRALLALPLGVAVGAIVAAVSAKDLR